MPEVGAPGSSSTNPEPAPPGTVWIDTEAPGYRVGVIPARNAVVIEPLEFHCAYILLTREEIERFLERGRDAKRS